MVLLLLAPASFAQSIPGFAPKSIRQFPLDAQTVYDIRIAKDEVTTLAFPGPITALEGAGITMEPQQNPAPVLLNYQEGRYYFSIRAVADNATASLNVIYKKQTYVLHLQTDQEPFRSVTFYQIGEAKDTASSPGRQPVNPTRLLGLIDRAKAHHIIQSQHPDWVSQVETTAPNRRMLYRDFDVVLAEVFRFDPEDTLIFKLLFYNNTDREICYQPQTLGVRVGTRVYYASLSDASGIIPPGSSHSESGQIQPSVSVGYFAITGTADGTKNNLSVKNEFNVLVSRVQP